MDIALIAGADSSNFTFPALRERLISLGHSVHIITTRSGEEHTRMFKEFSDSVISKKDWIESGRTASVAVYESLQDDELYKNLRTKGCSLISMGLHLLPTEYVFGPGNTNADIIACSGEKFKRDQVNNGILHTIIPTGSPQYDGIKKVPGKSGQVLFLEQHFYPAGPKGKNQLAMFLTTLAKRNPKQKIIVKPRTIPSQLGVATHKSEHVYDYIEKLGEGIPDNLFLLREHLDLGTLIEESETILTTFSTAVIPGMLLGRNVAFIGGFDSIDTEYYSLGVIDAYYRNVSASKQVFSFDTFELSQAKEIPDAFVSDIHYKFNGDATGKVCTLIESIEEYFIKKNLTIPILECDFENHQQTFSDYSKKSSSSNNEKVRQEREAAFLYNQALEAFYLTNIRSGYKLTENYKALQRELSKALTEGKAAECLRLSTEATEQAVRELIASPKEHCRGYLGWCIEYLFHKKRYEEIQTLPKEFESPDLNLYLGLILEKQGKKKEAETKLELYLKDFHSTPYRLSPAFHDYASAMAESALERIRKG